MDIYITDDKNIVNEIVDIHIATFQGFFLTFLGKGFLKQLYKGYIEHKQSNLIIARQDKEIVGFIAYSSDISDLYKYLIKKKLLLFAWYSFAAFIKNPKILFRLLSAFSKSEEVSRKEKYIELASIGVKPNVKAQGIGSSMISYMKEQIDFNEYKYISLETDAENNEYANKFYLKNGFVLIRTYETKQGRKMNEYRYFHRN
ncbi:GNAT family N-acetyltransferase [Massilimicrobiota sp. SW1139]|uniref:GNAT family N-acetyltransferase n=1 Tax=Massilimicrobiota sp. SW1139 TaxID=2530043 RepID=UPI00143AA0C3|nr:GNAT family N-acetyltransferase [Massilimicrobiota sp. SW1139]NJE45599.1 N-acetyltransferase [Massilimicrobiota sp. SW1139]